ncbi:MULTISPECIES: helix-turn-helix transcriptional regulator [Pseudonocardia]|uniref:ArsR family transcriptional regulator n=1 Tax=Pseudonocardia alni subsp. carboxydivorans TaxID=415010 RepID=A0ABU9AHM5_PSEA5|nr:helix-turn-helix transcriptional regulator [Pseudonocardia alni]
MSEIEERLRAVEQAVVELQEARRAAARPDAVGSADTAVPDDDALWALTGLEARSPGAVLMAGSVGLPGDEGTVRWQYARPGEVLLDADWPELSATLDALAHPARLAILQHVLGGVHSTAELLEQPSVGTTGQLHHHLRQLVAAGWLASTRRGHYEVPAARVVPLLVTVLAAHR